MEDLHILVGKYGYKKIDEELRRLKEETYKYLRSEYETKEKRNKEMITEDKLREYGSIKELSRVSGYTEKYIEKLLKGEKKGETVNKVEEKDEKVEETANKTEEKKEEPLKQDIKKLVVKVRKAKMENKIE